MYVDDDDVHLAAALACNVSQATDARKHTLRQSKCHTYGAKLHYVSYGNIITSAIYICLGT